MKRRLGFPLEDDWPESAMRSCQVGAVLKMWYLDRLFRVLLAKDIKILFLKSIH